jgi:hypothetical protein
MTYEDLDGTYMNTTVVFLDIIHRHVFYLKRRPVFI